MVAACMNWSHRELIHGHLEAKHEIECMCQKKCEHEHRQHISNEKKGPTSAVVDRNCDELSKIPITFVWTGFSSCDENYVLV